MGKEDSTLSDKLDQKDGSSAPIKAEAKSPEEQVTGKGEKKFTEAEVSEMLDAKLKGIMEQLENMKTDLSEKQQPQIFRLMKDEEDLKPSERYGRTKIPEGDTLKEPIHFFAYGTGYELLDSTVNGALSPNPLGRFVQFKHVARYDTNKGGRDNKIIHISMYTCFSKAESAWLRTLPQFNVFYFEKVIAHKNVDYDDYMAGMTASQMVNSLSQTDVIVQYQNAVGKNPIDDFEAMKFEVMMHFKKGVIADHKKKNDELKTRMEEHMRNS